MSLLMPDNCITTDSIKVYADNFGVVFVTSFCVKVRSLASNFLEMRKPVNGHLTAPTNKSLFSYLASIAGAACHTAC